MADPIRSQILAALVTKLKEITETNGYRGTIDTVEVLARDWGDGDLRNDVVPWCGIVPQQEVARYKPFGHVEVDWPIIIICHFNLTTRTSVGIYTECEEWRTDFKRKLHEVPSLGVDGVHFVQVDTVDTTEAAVAAIQHGKAGIQLKAKIRFTESASAQ